MSVLKHLLKATDLKPLQAHPNQLESISERPKFCSKLLICLIRWHYKEADEMLLKFPVMLTLDMLYIRGTMSALLLINEM